MKFNFLTTLILTSLLLSACDNAPKQSETNVVKTETVAVEKAEKAEAKNQVVPFDGEMANEADAEVESKEPESAENKERGSAYKQISWEDLEIPGKGMDSILEQFDEEINSIPEGSIKEKEMMGRLQASLNSAPINPELDKKNIKLSGFVSPLEIDQKAGVVKEFLLVPYFGACIHVPPPPLNQTLLVKLEEDQYIKLEDAYDPVWVLGKIHAESTVTRLAEAGYEIKGASIEPYKGHLQE